MSFEYGLYFLVSVIAIYWLVAKNGELKEEIRRLERQL